VPASDVEKLIIKSVREHLKPCPSIDDRDLITTQLARVEVQPKQLIIHLTGAPSATAKSRSLLASTTTICRLMLRAASCTSTFCARDDERLIC
jgi:hypothetical protein